MKPPHFSHSKLKKSISILSAMSATDGTIADDMLLTEGKWFKDSLGRVIMLRGVNLSGGTKIPAVPFMPSHRKDSFFDHRNVSFVGRPFPLAEADEHLARLRSWGFNFLRFNVTWEAIEHSGPGLHDFEYFDYVVQILLKAKTFGFKCFIDPHQDVWSRFTGGSGAPGWTLDLVGFDMTKFSETGAALVHNTFSDPDNFPRMIWPTNYSKLACCTMFTLFFAGNVFAPKCMVDTTSPNDPKMIILSKNSPSTGDNYVTIQDFLQDHYCNAVAALIKHISKTEGLFDSVVVGYDTLNEPSGGFLGIEKLSQISKHQILKNGLTPTALQAMLTGQGKACDIENWAFGSLGPHKKGTIHFDPKGLTCWKDGYSCIWEQHGLYDKVSGTALKDDYFFRHPETQNEIDWISDFWKPFVRTYTKAVRSIHENAIIFLEPPVNEIPPLWDPSEGDPTERICFTPHWYDGITLMNKHFSSWWTIDYTGYTRGKYSNILAALSFGIKGIKKNFGKQLDLIRSEGIAYIGETPFLLGEIGIPYDMDSKRAYKNGDYNSQIQALDANLSALENTKSNYTLWNYCSDNNNKRGDNWNGEDLSIFSRGTSPKFSENVEAKRFKIDLISMIKKSEIYEKTGRKRTVIQTLDSSITKLFTESKAESVRSEATVEMIHNSKHVRAVTSPADFGHMNLDEGGRALGGFLRPCPLKINGLPVSVSFDYRSKTKEFKFSFKANVPFVPRKKGVATEIFVPKWYFGRPLALHLHQNNLCDDPTFIESPQTYVKPLSENDFFFDVKLSSGSWTYDEDSQLLHFFHGSKEKEKLNLFDSALQEIIITIVTKKEIVKRLGLQEDVALKVCTYL